MVVVCLREVVEETEIGIERGFSWSPELVVVSGVTPPGGEDPG